MFYFLIVLNFSHKLPPMLGWHGGRRRRRRVVVVALREGELDWNGRVVGGRRLHRRWTTVVGSPLWRRGGLVRRRHRPAAHVNERNDSTSGRPDQCCRNHLTIGKHNVKSTQRVVFTTIQSLDLLLLLMIHVWWFKGVVNVLLWLGLAHGLVHVLVIIVTHRISHELDIWPWRWWTSTHASGNGWSGWSRRVVWVQQSVVIPAAAVLWRIDRLRMDVGLGEEFAIVERNVDWVCVDVSLVSCRRRDSSVREVKPQLVPETSFVPPNHGSSLNQKVKFWSSSKVERGQLLQKDNDRLPPLEVLERKLDLGPLRLKIRSRDNQQMLRTELRNSRERIRDRAVVR